MYVISFLFMGVIRFRKDWETAYSLLINQLLRFPLTSEHDDALECAVHLARASAQAGAGIEGLYINDFGRRFALSRAPRWMLKRLAFLSVYLSYVSFQVR